MPAECAMPAKFGIWLSLPLQTGTRSSYEKNPCSLTETGRYCPLRINGPNHDPISASHCHHDRLASIHDVTIGNYVD
jgi:hypothetical protein